MSTVKHKVTVRVPVERRGLLGFKKTVLVTKTIEVDSKTYKEMRNAEKHRPYSIEEMMFYDELLGDD